MRGIVFVMADDHDGVEGTGADAQTVASTTWAWKRVRIAPAPQAEGTVRAQRAPLRGLLPWPRRKPMTLTIKFRGGKECWYEIRARGRTIRRPGPIALHDLMRELYADFMP